MIQASRHFNQKSEYSLKNQGINEFEQTSLNMKAMNVTEPEEYINNVPHYYAQGKKHETNML